MDKPNLTTDKYGRRHVKVMIPIGIRDNDELVLLDELYYYVNDARSRGASVITMRTLTREYIAERRDINNADDVYIDCFKHWVKEGNFDTTFRGWWNDVMDEGETTSGELYPGDDPSYRSDVEDTLTFDTPKRILDKIEECLGKKGSPYFEYEECPGEDFCEWECVGFGGLNYFGKEMTTVFDPELYDTLMQVYNEPMTLEEFDAITDKALGIWDRICREEGTYGSSDD